MKMSPPPRVNAFSLVELLVVMSLALIFIGLAVPVLGKVVLGSELTRAGQKMESQLALARQNAVSTNREIRVMFYELPANSQLRWNAFQVLSVQETADGPKITPLGNLERLPAFIAIEPQAVYSPLLTADSALAETTTLPEFGQVRRAGFRYRPSGATGAAVTPERNFITLVRQEHLGSSGVPANYYTVQVEPLTGKVRTFRP
jgi:uncharacterized protein (TIGR02596 family)